MEKYISKNPRETAGLAKLLAEESLRTKPDKRALVVGLIGELGSGKTTFIQSFIKQLGISKKVTSPTFLISRKYLIPRSKKFKNVFHVDVYRIGKAKELNEVGVAEAIKEPNNIVLVEWADKIRKTLPEDTIWIKFRHGKNKEERYITFS